MFASERLQYKRPALMASKSFWNGPTSSGFSSPQAVQQQRLPQLRLARTRWHVSFRQVTLTTALLVLPPAPTVTSFIRSGLSSWRDSGRLIERLTDGGPGRIIEVIRDISNLRLVPSHQRNESGQCGTQSTRQGLWIPVE